MLDIHLRALSAGSCGSQYVRDSAYNLLIETLKLARLVMEKFERFAHAVLGLAVAFVVGVIGAFIIWLMVTAE